MRAVRFDRYGGTDLLGVRGVPDPRPGPGQVVVAVRAAASNLGQAGLREDMDDGRTGALSLRAGSDLAGVVHQVAESVAAPAAVEQVLGWSWDRSNERSGRGAAA